jgi:hypothetical protein
MADCEEDEYRDGEEGEYREQVGAERRCRHGQAYLKQLARWRVMSDYRRHGSVHVARAFQLRVRISKELQMRGVVPSRPTASPGCMQTGSIFGHASPGPCGLRRRHILNSGHALPARGRADIEPPRPAQVLGTVESLARPAHDTAALCVRG